MNCLSLSCDSHRPFPSHAFLSSVPLNPSQLGIVSTKPRLCPTSSCSLPRSVFLYLTTSSFRNTLQNEPFLQAPGSLPASIPRTRNETEGSPAPPSSPSPLPPAHPLPSRGRVSEPRHGNYPTFSPLSPQNILHLLPITDVTPSYHLLPPSLSYPNPKKPTHPIPPSHFSSLVSTPFIILTLYSSLAGSCSAPLTQTLPPLYLCAPPCPHYQPFPFSRLPTLLVTVIQNFEIKPTNGGCDGPGGEEGTVPGRHGCPYFFSLLSRLQHAVIFTNLDRSIVKVGAIQSLLGALGFGRRAEADLTGRRGGGRGGGREGGKEGGRGWKGQRHQNAARERRDGV
jgi:hypothetical protein